MTASSENNGIWRSVFRLRSVLVLLDVMIIILNSIIIPSPNDNFLVVPLLHSGPLEHKPVYWTALRRNLYLGEEKWQQDVGKLHGHQFYLSVV